jgi:hypothetical protein
MGFAISSRKPSDAPVQYLPPGEKQSLLSQLGQRSGQAIEALQLLLDTPGAITRGVLAGDPLSGFSFDRERRVTGEELLDSYGLKPESGYLSTPAGFAAELALDPLAYATFALKAGGQASSAASKAGLLKYAPYVASLKRGSEQTRTGKYTLDAIQKAGLKPTTSVLQTRPLVGQRLSQATTTLDELVQAAPDPTSALQKVRDALGQTPYASVKDQRVGGLFGLSNPFTGQGWAYNPNMLAGKTDDLTNLNLAENIADVLDRAGQGVAWSYPARVASSMFDKAVGGEIDVAGQIGAMRRYGNEQDALKGGRAEATLHAMRLNSLVIPSDVAQRTGVNKFYSPEGADSLLRLVEGKPIGNDAELLRGVAGLDDWIVEWRQIADRKLAAAKSLGLKSRSLQDPFGVFFSPRSGPELDLTDASLNAPARRSQYSTDIENQYSRNPALAVPGGTYQLQEISLDPQVRSWMKGETDETELEIGRRITALIGNPLVTEEQGAKIAQVFRELGKDVPDDVPVFGTHPVIEQMGYIINEELRQSNARSAFEALADAVVIRNGTALRATDVPGGRHIPMSQAMQEIGERLGFATNKRGFVVSEAQDQVKQLIAQNFFAPGTDPSSLRLSQLTVPREVVNRIIRVHDFYASPKVQQEVGGMFQKFTTMWKASVLAWPSRFVRDLYSNAFSLWVETGSATETLQGLMAGSKVLNNQYNELLPYFRSIPRYASMNLTDQQLIDQVQLDVGTTGILSGLASADLLSSNRRGDVGQFIPGSTPISVGKALQELRPQAGVSMGQRLRDFVTVKGVTNDFETRNSVFNASNMLGDTIDSMGRLGGFFSLMRLGVAPEEAARRMMRSLVDYSSLTPYERGTIRNIAPWWAYWSRQGKYVTQQLIENPGGRYAQTLRGINDAQATTEETYIPTALRQRFAIRLGEFDGSGGQTFLTDLDIPGVDILNTVRLGYQPDVLGSVLQTGQQTLGEVVNQLNPLIRTGAELVTGQDFFSKRPLDQAVTPIDTIYQAATGDRFARINPLIRAGFNTAISAVPLGSRGVSALASAVDPRIENVPFRLLKTAVNNTTGVKINTIDKAFADLDALGKIRQQLAPYNREFVQSYIPKELLPNIPYESQRMNALSKDLQRNLRNLYAQRYSR